MNQTELDLGIANKRLGVNPNDIVFTPPSVAKMVLKEFQPKGFVLEPCRGLGGFYNELSEPKDWCEIADGRDFFDYHKHVDWIVSNPPYSNWDKWLEHSFEIADDILYVVPIAKVYKSWGTLKAIRSYGWIEKVMYMPASLAGFPFGFPCGAFHFKRGYCGKTESIFYDE